LWLGQFANRIVDPCRACGKDFMLTSGTLFASHKLPLRTYLAAIAIFCNEVKGKSALRSPAISQI
jgi:hypothetical protein